MGFRARLARLRGVGLGKKLAVLNIILVVGYGNICLYFFNADGRLWENVIGDLLMIVLFNSWVIYEHLKMQRQNPL